MTPTLLAVEAFSWTAMLSPQLIPRIRVDLLDGSPRTLSPSSTLDIRDILGPVDAWPNLLAENFVSDDAQPQDALCSEDGRLQVVPSFPMDRKPPLFFLHSHRARLPFPIRQEAFEMGDFCRDEEDAFPLLTAPTIPRMKLMIKEQLYVQKWVDTLTPDNPPRHIPWSCEKPATERRWIAEGSIFPADTIKSEQRAVIQELSCVINVNRFSAHCTDLVPHSGDFCEVSSPIHIPTESLTSTSHVPLHSTDVNTGIFRSESKTSHTPHSIVRTLQASSPPSLLPSGLPTPMTSTTPDAPLAARRGKSLGDLKLKTNVIEPLEYPDIPTAFRGSPSVWSPRFDVFPLPSFTDHQSMLLDLKTRSAALGSGVSTERLHPQPEITRTSPNTDEWMFTRGLATFDPVPESADSEVPKESIYIVDTSIFLPDDTSTPAKAPGFTAHLEFAPRLHSTPALPAPLKRSSHPPGVPLPPRPALINPSTPPHVRGILKKIKSVRFEDIATMERREIPPVVLPPQFSQKRLSTQHLAAPSSRRPSTPVPSTTKPFSGPTPARETSIPGRIAEGKKPVPRSRLPPKRTQVSGKPEPSVASNPPETSKSTTAATPVERPCRIAHAKRTTNPPIAQQAHAKRLSVTEVDIRRGIEGATKSRLSTPLRNIFRFK